jgi:hypothetical protein
MYDLSESYLIAIDALDFLSLGYQPKQPKFAFLFTPQIVERYKTIHRFILKLIRVEEAVNSLFTWRRWHHSKKNLAKIEELYSKSKRFINGLFRYSMDIAVSDPWRIFTQHLDAALGGESEFITDVNSLSILHVQALDRIKWRLFLRTNQRKMAGFLDETMQVLVDLLIGRSY